MPFVDGIVFYVFKLLSYHLLLSSEKRISADHIIGGLEGEGGIRKLQVRFILNPLTSLSPPLMQPTQTSLMDRLVMHIYAILCTSQDTSMVRFCALMAETLFKEDDPIVGVS